MGARRGAYRVLVGKPEGKRPLGRSRLREGKIILRWIFKEIHLVVYSGCSRLRTVTRGGLLWKRR
jgi:hypothetical protein